jgi:AraC-like DNA-binding protein
MELYRIIRAIVSNYDNSLFGVNELAEQLRISQSYLRELTCMNFGMCPHKLIETIRLEKTIELLTQNAKQYRIAKRVGYASTRSFRRAFQKRLGISPGIFKHMVLNNSYNKDNYIRQIKSELWQI